MDGLLSVLVVIGIIVKIMKKNGAAPKKGTKKTVFPASAPVQAQPAAPITVPAGMAAAGVPAMPESAAYSIPVPATPNVPTQPEPCEPQPHGHAEGESHSDGEGCVGGSIAHAHEESPAARRPEREQAGSAPVSGRRIGAAQLRQAVVMSEILGRPVALRGRTAGK